MKKRYDVIVIGAGSVGQPTAFFLAKEGVKVLCIDKNASSGQGQNKAAIGGVRATHSDPAKMEICQQSLEIFSTCKEKYGLDVGWKKGGYCFPVYREKEELLLKGMLKEQKKHNLNINWESPDRIKELVPGINPKELRGGTYSPDDGQISPLLAAEAFETNAIENGADFLFHSEVIGFVIKNSKICGVKTAKDTYFADIVVNAAGAYAQNIGEMAGITIPIISDSHEAGISAPIAEFLNPLVVDLREGLDGKTSNMYFGQNHENAIIFCYTPNPLIQGTDRRSTSDFMPTIAKRLVSIMPRFKNLRIRRLWRGLYPMTPDGFAIVGKAPKIDNFYLGVGMCGQGLMLGPGVAKNIASLILTGKPSIDEEVSKISVQNATSTQEKLKHLNSSKKGRFRAIMRNKNVSFISIILTGLLVAGYTIGAGVLGLPVVTGIAGFIPASIAMVVVWVTLYSSAWFMAKQFIFNKNDDCDYITVFNYELGSFGKWLAIVGFLIIYYGALTAYLAGAVNIIVGIFDLHIPTYFLVIACFCAYTFIILYGINAVQKGNLLFMLTLIISFIYLVYTIAPSIEVKNYLYVDWKFVPCIFSVLIFSSIPFLIVPSVCRKLKYSPKPILISLIIGGVLSFLISYIWTAATIGALPLTGHGQTNMLYAYRHNLSAVIPMAKIGGSKSIFVASAIFSVLAISTSYLGTGIAAIGFIKDLTYTKLKIKNKFLIFSIAFAPPLIITLIDPNIFLSMLNLVGGAGFCLVGGVIPAIIYIKHTRKNPIKQLIGYILFLFFLSIVIFEVVHRLGLIHLAPHITK